MALSKGAQDTFTVDQYTGLMSRLAAVETIVEERDNRYELHFKKIEEAAVAFQERYKGESAAKDKAIDKSEQAQTEYNVRSNEFRGQLDDQAKTLMPRIDAEARFASLAEKVEDAKKERIQQIETLAKDLHSKYEQLRSDIASLRESRSVESGKAQVSDPVQLQALKDIKDLLTAQAASGGIRLGASALWAYIVGAIGLAYLLYNFATAVSAK